VVHFSKQLVQARSVSYKGWGQQHKKANESDKKYSSNWK